VAPASRRRFLEHSTKSRRDAGATKTEPGSRACAIALAHNLVEAYFRGLLFVMRNRNVIRIQFANQKRGLGSKTCWIFFPSIHSGLDRFV